MHQTGPSVQTSVCVFCLPSRCCGFWWGYQVIVDSKLTATCALPLIWSSVMADTHSQLSKMAASTRMTVRLLFSLRGDWNVRIREPSEREREKRLCFLSLCISAGCLPGCEWGVKDVCCPSPPSSPLSPSPRSSDWLKGQKWKHYSIPSPQRSATSLNALKTELSIWLWDGSMLMNV